MPKKGGFTVVPNKNDEMIPTRTILGYRRWINFRKLNKETRKDHYLIPFIDQMLEIRKTFLFLLSRWLFNFFADNCSF